MNTCMRLWLCVAATLATASNVSADVAGVAAAVRSGQQVANGLTQRYHNTSESCANGSRPAYVCTGVILRGTLTSMTDAYDVWNPSPTAVNVGGVSFSYIRSDYKMSRLANFYNHGFILYPPATAPAKATRLTVLCFFPVDGASDNRSDNGCGPVRSDAQAGKPCAARGVTTGVQWVAHYKAEPALLKRCSFDVRESLGSQAVRNFNEGLNGGRMASAATIQIPNDLKIQLWPQDIPGQLPIEAFFYVSSAGLQSARHNQRRYRQLTGITLPVIALSMPTTPYTISTFTFNAADQN